MSEISYSSTDPGYPDYDPPVVDQWPMADSILSELCFDTDDDRYDPFGVERWHDLYLDRVKISRTPRLSGIFTTEHGTVEYRQSESLVVIPCPLPPYEIANASFLRDAVAALCGQEVDGTKAYYTIDDPEHLREYVSAYDFPLQHMDVSSLFSPVTTLLEKANPLRKDVDIPSFLTETLKDLPSLIFTRGRSLLGAVGSTNLQYQFGWKPLIADLKSLIDFNAKLSKRLSTIADLEKPFGITGYAKLEEHEDSDSDSRTYYGAGPFDPDSWDITYLYSRRTVMKRWGCVRYTADASQIGEFRQMSADQKQWLAIQTLYGLHWRNPAALWEILPWSWMIDWFVPFQQMLERYSNRIILNPEKSAVMTSRTTSVSAQCTSVTGFSSPVDLKALSFEILRETKQRDVSNSSSALPSVPAGRPILDLRKLGILASLVGKIL